jgi:hypothetical protein
MQLMASDDHGNTAIEAAHDNMTLAGMTPQQLHAVFASVVHLH